MWISEIHRGGMWISKINLTKPVSRYGTARTNVLVWLCWTRNRQIKQIQVRNEKGGDESRC